MPSTILSPPTRREMLAATTTASAQSSIQVDPLIEAGWKEAPEHFPIRLRHSPSSPAGLTRGSIHFAKGWIAPELGSTRVPHQ